jgi:peptidoglycan/xylan/chitin deacetylase (PgdA/CDA1 family)
MSLGNTLGSRYKWALGWFNWGVSNAFFGYSVPMRNKVPLISFSFDDFPRSAVHTAGRILGDRDIKATYYTSLGLMDKEAPVGKIFSREDLGLVVEQGHELGCHTFSHCHSWDTSPSVFENSVIKNRQSLQDLIPGESFQTLSYPISYPRPHTKRRVAKHFLCCRGGGFQTYNIGRVRKTFLHSFFLEKSRDDLNAVRKVIDGNARAGGWLIFSTHDVCENPTQFGCIPSFFERVVDYATASGARIVPVASGWRETVKELEPQLQRQSLSRCFN